jgi:hypothetical protein
MTPEELFGQFLGLGKAWCVHEARLEARSSTSLLKVDEMTQLWPEENARAGIPDGQIRQVGKSASRQKTSPCPCKVQREDWAGIIRVAMPASGHDGLLAHPTG